MNCCLESLKGFIIWFYLHELVFAYMLQFIILMQNIFQVKFLLKNYKKSLLYNDFNCLKMGIFNIMKIKSKTQ